MSEIFGSASDFGSAGLQELSDAQSSTGFAGSGQDNQDNYARAVANIIARPRVGDPRVVGRSNIRDAVNYDPLFAQALNISRGLLPGNTVIGTYPTQDKFQGRVYDLNRPSNLRPQIQGKDGKMYFSKGEELIQNMPQIGIMGIIQNLIDYGKKTYDSLTNEKGEDGIMNNLDRAELSDTTKAILSGMDKAKQNKGTEVAMDLKNFITPELPFKAIGAGINYFKPQIESMLPEGATISGGPKYIIDDSGEGKFQPNIELKVPVENMGLTQILKAIG